MYIFKVKVYQAIENELGEMEDKTFSEYVKSMKDTSHIVNRFSEPESGRDVYRIKIQRIWVMD